MKPKLPLPAFKGLWLCDNWPLFTNLFTKSGTYFGALYCFLLLKSTMPLILLIINRIRRYSFGLWSSLILFKCRFFIHGSLCCTFLSSLTVALLLDWTARPLSQMRPKRNSNCNCEAFIDQGSHSLTMRGTS